MTWRAIEEHAVDTVVIDTAPSRNAVDFINYPKRLARLLGSRAIGWMTRLGARAADPGRGRMNQVERLLVWAIGPVVSDVADFFVELARVRERFVELNDHVVRLLLDPSTHYFLVAAPTSAARDDAQYLIRRLRSLKISPRALILNSAFVPEKGWLEVLERSDLESDDLRTVLETLKEEHQIRERASAAVAQRFHADHPSLEQHRLPHIEVPDPKEVVLALSRQLNVGRLLAV